METKQNKKILCKCCGGEIANLHNGKIIFDNMKALSILEVSIVDNSKEAKCRSCNSWNSFDVDNNQTLNQTRKSKEVLFGYERNTVKFKSGNNLKK